MTTTDEIVICWECGQVFTVNEDYDKIKAGRKSYNYHDGMYCPLCHQGFLMVTSLKKIERQRIESRDDARRYRREIEDWQDNYALARDASAAKSETIQRLQHEIDDLRQLDLSRPSPGVCLWCGKELVNHEDCGRRKLYCSAACRNRAYRSRQRNL